MPADPARRPARKCCTSFIYNKFHVFAAPMFPRQIRQLTLLGALMVYRLVPMQASVLAHLPLLSSLPSRSGLSFAAGAIAVSHDTMAT